MYNTNLQFILIFDSVEINHSKLFPNALTIDIIITKAFNVFCFEVKFTYGETLIPV